MSGFSWSQNKGTTSTSNSSTTGTSSFGSFNSFGSTSNSSTSNWGTKGFNQGKSGAGQQVQTQYQAVLSDDPLFTRIWNIRCAYNPDSPAYRFCFVFYNKRTSDKWQTTPKNFSEADWVKICSEMPDSDHLTPCPTYGFAALHERAENQKKIVQDLKTRMDILQSKLSEMSSFYDTELRGIFDRLVKNMTQINQILIQVVGVLASQQGNPLSPEEEKMKNELESMQQELDQPGKFKSAIDDLDKRVQNMLEQQQIKTARKTLDNETKSSLAAALKVNQNAIEVLQHLVKDLKKQIVHLESD